jgi:hypothetical protein
MMAELPTRRCQSRNASALFRIVQVAALDQPWLPRCLIDGDPSCIDLTITLADRHHHAT